MREFFENRGLKEWLLLCETFVLFGIIVRTILCSPGIKKKYVNEIRQNKIRLQIFKAHFSSLLTLETF